MTDLLLMLFLTGNPLVWLPIILVMYAIGIVILERNES